MRVVIVGDKALILCEGVSEWGAAMLVNPGILPDEYRVFEGVMVTPAMLDRLDDD
jgi:hypothetical protein